jgi:hypothetical protein
MARGGKLAGATGRAGRRGLVGATLIWGGGRGGMGTTCNAPDFPAAKIVCPLKMPPTSNFRRPPQPLRHHPRGPQPVTGHGEGEVLFPTPAAAAPGMVRPTSSWWQVPRRTRSDARSDQCQSPRAMQLCPHNILQVVRSASLMVPAPTAASCSPLTATSAAALSLLHRWHEPPERTPSTSRSPHAWGAEGTATMCITFTLDHGGKGDRRLGKRSLDMGARWSLPLASACILASLYSSVDPKGRASAVRGHRRRQVQSQQ